LSLTVSKLKLDKILILFESEFNFFNFKLIFKIFL